MFRLQFVRARTAAFSFAASLVAASLPAFADEAPASSPEPAVAEAPAEPQATSLAEQARLASILPASMTVCPRMAQMNRPDTDENLVVIGYEPLVQVNAAVTLASAPVAAACISSGFGPRRSGTHKGIDYFNRDPVDVYAAGAGTVKEKTYRNDFGNMLVIDHGNGVFTRYAHLQEFAPGIAEGESVEAGQVIAVMGNTAGYKIARHLHYEILTGEWGERTASFALTPLNVYDLPAPREDALS